jgi:hypothetical protein
MAIISDLLKDLLIWAMTFVGEDVNQFRMIVGILCYATLQAYNYYQEKCFYTNNNNIKR